VDQQHVGVAPVAQEQTLAGTYGHQLHVDPALILIASPRTPTR
jgi:hypothetical protein